MKHEMKISIIYVAILFAGVARTHASSDTRVWYGDQGGSVTLPCGDSTTAVELCWWSVPKDGSGTCSGQNYVAMSSIVSGQHPGLATAGGDRICDLRLDDLTREEEGLWTCRGSTFQLLVKGVTTPTLLADGRQMADGSILTTLTTRKHTLRCYVQWSRPAASIRWLVGESDVSDHATTVSSPAWSKEGLQSCPAVEGDSTWQVTSSLALFFAEGDKKVSCVVSHSSLPVDLAIAMTLEVANGATGLKSAGAVQAEWCLLAAATVLLLSVSSKRDSAMTHDHDVTRP